jgi:hypothetical protein
MRTNHLEVFDQRRMVESYEDVSQHRLRLGVSSSSLSTVKQYAPNLTVHLFAWGMPDLTTSSEQMLSV